MNKNLFSFLIVFTMLAINCISCSHNRAISADAGLTDDEAQVSSASESSDESPSAEAEKKAEDLVGSTDEAKGTLEASSTGTETTSSDAAVLLGMESSTPEDSVQVAQASTPTENPVITGGQPLDKSVKSMEMPSIPSATSFGAVSETDKKDIGEKSHHNKKSIGHPKQPKVEATPTEKKVETPVAKNIEEPFVDEMNAPIPEQEKPKLASAEIGSFIERHAFLVTLCAVAFVFGLFIFMRRKSDHEDGNLSV